jgi:hypothetical protein
MDRRQPLPSLFAARWLEGGIGAFNSHYTRWREGTASGAQTCSTAGDNAELTVARIIRFDERENGYMGGSYFICTPCGRPYRPRTPAAGPYATADNELFPDNHGVDVSGWMYLDLNNGGSPNYTAAREGFAPSETVVRASQNWVTTTMHAMGRFGVAIDAAMLRNGCTPSALPIHERAIAPAEHTTP